MPQINVRHVKVLTLAQVMPKWKELKVLVHPDDTVCMLPDGECNMPHTLVIGMYKLKSQWRGQPKP